MVDKLLELVKGLESIFIVLVPAIYYACFRIYSKVKETKTKEKALNKRKAFEEYDNWEHEESKRIIHEIKNYCNYFKDKGHADLVQYLQLENGTMATSKIQNMFLTCLAEDDRSGSIQKFIKKIQRLPYSEAVCWLGDFVQTSSMDDVFICSPDLEKEERNKTAVEDIVGIGSVIIAPVYTSAEILLGICVFYYHEKNYNGRYKTEHKYMTDFRASVTSLIANYHQIRDSKRDKLDLEEE